MSRERKFDYEEFMNEDFSSSIAFAADRYSEEEAKRIAAQEEGWNEKYIKVRHAHVYYGFGIDWDGLNTLTYWLSDHKTNNSFPVIVCEEVRRNVR